MTTRNQRIADALRAYYRSEHSAPITLMHAADLIEQLQRDLDDAQAGESIAQMAAPRAQEQAVPADEFGYLNAWLNTAREIGEGESKLADRMATRLLRIAEDDDLPVAQQPTNAHEQTAAAMAADNCEMWRQRAQRQPLTYEQIEAIFSEAYGQNLQEHLTGCARAIERAHGIGTEGGVADVLAEREACAALVDKLARRLNGSAKQVARETATLIRARGQEGGAA